MPGASQRKTFKKGSSSKQTQLQQRKKHNNTENLNPPQNQGSLLNSKIACNDDLRQILSRSSIELCNQILPTLKQNDPGLVVQILNKHDLHVALALPNSPVPQGGDETASEAAFRVWIVAQAFAAPGVGPNSQYPPQSNSLAFHHLTEGEANAIVYANWLVIPWVYEIKQQVPILEMPLVLWMAGTGRGRAEMIRAEQVFQ
jgi:hypothetical protein